MAGRGRSITASIEIGGCILMSASRAVDSANWCNGTAAHAQMLFTDSATFSPVDAVIPFCKKITKQERNFQVIFRVNMIRACKEM